MDGARAMVRADASTNEIWRPLYFMGLGMVTDCVVVAIAARSSEG